MLTQKHGKVEWEVPTKPVEMKKAVVAAGQPRKVGDIVEVRQHEFNHMVAKGVAIPHLGEPVVTKKKTRKKKKDD